MYSVLGVVFQLRPSRQKTDIEVRVTVSLDPHTVCPRLLESGVSYFVGRTVNDLIPTYVDL